MSEPGDESRPSRSLIARAALRVTENWSSSWPLAYLVAVIWSAIAIARFSRSGSFAALDLVIIGLWLVIGTAGLIGRIKRSRRDR